MKKILLLMGLMFSGVVSADQCPDPEQVRERYISHDYDWSVGEDVTLTMLFEVSELKKVELKNYGEFIACHYQSRDLSVRLDGVALKLGCFIREISEAWLALPGGNLSCAEEDLMNCRFEILCL